MPIEDLEKKDRKSESPDSTKREISERLLDEARPGDPRSQVSESSTNDSEKTSIPSNTSSEKGLEKITELKSVREFTRELWDSKQPVKIAGIEHKYVEGKGYVTDSYAPNLLSPEGSHMKNLGGNGPSGGYGNPGPFAFVQQVKVGEGPAARTTDVVLPIPAFNPDQSTWGKEVFSNFPLAPIYRDLPTGTKIEGIPFNSKAGPMPSEAVNLTKGYPSDNGGLISTEFFDQSLSERAKQTSLGDTKFPPGAALYTLRNQPGVDVVGVFNQATKQLQVTDHAINGGVRGLTIDDSSAKQPMVEKSSTEIPDSLKKNFETDSVRLIAERSRAVETESAPKELGRANDNAEKIPHFDSLKDMPADAWGRDVEIGKTTYRFAKGSHTGSGYSIEKGPGPNLLDPAGFTYMPSELRADPGPQGKMLGVIQQTNVDGWVARRSSVVADLPLNDLETRGKSAEYGKDNKVEFSEYNPKTSGTVVRDLSSAAEKINVNEVPDYSSPRGIPAEQWGKPVLIRGDLHLYQEGSHEGTGYFKAGSQYSELNPQNLQILQEGRDTGNGSHGRQLFTEQIKVGDGPGAFTTNKVLSFAGPNPNKEEWGKFVTKGADGKFNFTDYPQIPARATRDTSVRTEAKAEGGSNGDFLTKNTLQERAKLTNLSDKALPPDARLYNVSHVGLSSPGSTVNVIGEFSYANNVLTVLDHPVNGELAGARIKGGVFAVSAPDGFYDGVPSRLYDQSPDIDYNKMRQAERSTNAESVKAPKPSASELRYPGAEPSYPRGPSTELPLASLPAEIAESSKPVNEAPRESKAGRAKRGMGGKAGAAVGLAAIASGVLGTMRPSQAKENNLPTFELSE